MAADTEREREALAWNDGLIGIERIIKIQLGMQLSQARY
jgi:hypothetical protein